ncbi:MAG TPA: hypothetical protein VGC42_23360 [Kofleriaceae bacterium]
MTGAPPGMSRGQRAYVIAMCALIGAAFAYAACDWGHWPHVMYLPLSGRLITRPGAAITIHYFGLLLWGAGGAGTGAIVGAGLCSLVPRPWSRRAYQLFGAWAITAIVLAGGYFTWSLWPW